MHEKYKILEMRLANQRKTTKPNQLNRAAKPVVPTTYGALHSEAGANKSSPDNVPKRDKSVELKNQHSVIQPTGADPSVDRPLMNEIQQRKCRAFLDSSSTASILHCVDIVESSYNYIPLVLPVVIQSNLPSESTDHQIVTRPNLVVNKEPVGMCSGLEIKLSVFAMETATRIKIIVTVPRFTANEVKPTRVIQWAKIEYCIRSNLPPAFVESNAPDPAPPPVRFINQQLALSNLSAVVRTREHPNTENVTENNGTDVKDARKTARATAGIDHQKQRKFQLYTYVRCQ